jgi:hypothetical protein
MHGFIGGTFTAHKCSLAWSPLSMCKVDVETTHCPTFLPPSPSESDLAKLTEAAHFHRKCGHWPVKFPKANRCAGLLEQSPAREQLASAPGMPIKWRRGHGPSLLSCKPEADWIEGSLMKLLCQGPVTSCPNEPPD